MGALFSFVVVFCGYVEQAASSPIRSSNDYFRSPVGFGVDQLGYKWLGNTGVSYGCSEGVVYHPGVDINRPKTQGDEDKGEPLYAIADGEVVYADDSHWASLIIRFSFGGKDYYAVYGHAEINSGSQGDGYVTFDSPYVGMHVERGQIVGLLWDHNTDAAHLHFEIRSSDHPNPSNGTDFCGFYGGKTENEIKRINRDPLAFIISYGYIDGTCRILDPQWLAGVFCWTSNPVGSSVSCNDGGYHLRYTMYENRTVAVEGSFSDSTKQSYCSHIQDSLNITTYLGSANAILGGDFGGWPGPGAIIGADGQPVQFPPDFITKKVWLQTPWGTETYKFGMNESFDTKAQSANIGDGSCLSGEIDTITGHFYLSKGYKEDPHSGDGAWRRVDSTITQCDNLKQGDTHTETKNTVIREWITNPGIYNIVYCIDHPQDDHNNGGRF
jgi:murein DD-endopeptidase MepM/ murein hydrolase activator NlpD